MLPEVPRGWSGTWKTSTESGAKGLHTDLAFNRTIPTNEGPIFNNLWASSNVVMNPVAGLWLSSAPLHGAIRGCPSTSICKTKVQAPALWPTSCTNHVLPIDTHTILNTYDIVTVRYAPPLDQDLFLIDISLDVAGEHEAINLVTGYATKNGGCNYTLNYTICTLRSAIGEYVAKSVQTSY